MIVVKNIARLSCIIYLFEADLLCFNSITTCCTLHSSTSFNYLSISYSNLHLSCFLAFQVKDTWEHHSNKNNLCNNSKCCHNSFTIPISFPSPTLKQTYRMPLPRAQDNVSKMPDTKLGSTLCSCEI
jgi:hypothetical protein